MSLKWRAGLQGLLRLGLGGLLIVASVDKLMHPFDFSMAVAGYGLVDQGTAMLVAVVLPMFEMLTGLLLVFGLCKETASLAAILLYSLFFVMVLQARLRGLDIDCGCYRVDGGGINVLKVIENAGLALAAGWFYHMQNNHPRCRARH